MNSVNNNPSTNTSNSSGCVVNFNSSSNNNNGNMASMNNAIMEVKTKMSMNMRFLVRERNKISFLAGVLGSLLELNWSAKTPIVAFLVMKHMSIYSEQLRQSVNNLKGASLSKRMECVDVFENSNEFKKFKGILTREMSFISNIIELFKTEIMRLLKSSPHFMDNLQLKNEVNSIHAVE